MLAVVGTVPDPDFPLTHGWVRRDGAGLAVDGRAVPVHRGTPALLAAALEAATAVGVPGVYAFLAGDTGKGEGSRKVYRFLEKELAEFAPEVLTFHYIQPHLGWHDRVLAAVGNLPRKPVLIADAGFMYVAKMSGQAARYDFFTPDAGELAFLADEQAPHPFYTRGFILHEENRAPELIRRAYRHGNAARHLVVKGACDYVANADGILGTVDAPSFPTMEAIGGTGDTLTGILSVLCAAGHPPVRAGLAAGRANRMTGCYAHPTPATQVSELIARIPEALSAAAAG